MGIEYADDVVDDDDQVMVAVMMTLTVPPVMLTVLVLVGVARRATAAVCISHRSHESWWPQKLVQIQGICYL